METNKLQEKVVVWIEESAKQIGDFAVQEIPPFIEEYLQWKFWEAAVETALGMVALVPFIIVLIYCKRFWNWMLKYLDHSEGTVLLPYIVINIICVLLAVCNFPDEQIKDMIQIGIAPKVYLIERTVEIIQK